MDDLDGVREEYLQLRARSRGALLATLEDDQAPSASYAPMVWLDGLGYLFLSDLASHTRNLKRCPSFSLLLIEDEDANANAFARRRITLRGEAHLVARDDSSYTHALAEFHRRFGQVMSLLESLPDFHLFGLELQSGRYIRGFGQAYDLTGKCLEDLVHVNPAK